MFTSKRITRLDRVVNKDQLHKIRMASWAIYTIFKRFYNSTEYPSSGSAFDLNSTYAMTLLCHKQS